MRAAAAICDVGQQMAQQQGFAHTGFAPDGNHRAGARAGLLPGRTQSREFRFTAEHRRRADSFRLTLAWLRLALHRVGMHGPFNALERHFAQIDFGVVTRNQLEGRG